MSGSSGNSIRSRILEVSTGLFAERGYAGNGIRDIAREADVSVSMVSYHFGGKLGILTEIFQQFFEDYGDVVATALCSEELLEAKIRALVAETTTFMKKHQAAFRIVTTELPHLRGEARDFQTLYLEMIHNLTDRWLLPDISGQPGCPDQEVLHRIVGPALLSMIYSTFLFGDGLEKAYEFTRDDAFYVEYVDTISSLILSAVTGMGQLKT